jgi:hypothetical protein
MNEKFKTGRNEKTFTNENEATLYWDRLSVINILEDGRHIVSNDLEYNKNGTFTVITTVQ